MPRTKEQSAMTTPVIDIGIDAGQRNAIADGLSHLLADT